MTGEPSDFDPQTLWQNQPKEQDAMTLAAIHAKARMFESKIQRRNAIEYIACGVVIVGFFPMLLNRQSWLMQAGAALTMLAVLFVAWQLHQRGSVESSLDPGEPLVEGYRRQLIRQRNALRTAGLWYLAPFLPGVLLTMLGRWFQAHVPARTLEQDHVQILVGGAIVILIFAGIWLLNWRGSNRLQKRIDELERRSQ